MAGQGNAERSNGLAQLGIDLSGTETQRNYTEKQRNGVELLERQRNGIAQLAK